MKKKDDIGLIIKQALEDKKISAPDATWSRITDTLDKKKKRRRRYFLLLIPVGLVILGSLFFSNRWAEKNDLKENETQIQYTDEKNQPQNTDSSTTRSNQGITNELQNDQDIVKQKQQSLDILSDSKQNKKQATSNIDSFTESNQVYYYYRSSDSSNVVSQNKKLIDSLVNAQNATMKVKDSINQIP